MLSRGRLARVLASIVVLVSSSTWAPPALGSVPDPSDSSTGRNADLREAADKAGFRLAQCPDDTTPLTLSRSVPRSDGGIALEFRMPGHLNARSEDDVATINLPPLDFDPTFASAVALDEYGFPPRPEGPASAPEAVAWRDEVLQWHVQREFAMCLGAVKAAISPIWTGREAYQFDDRQYYRGASARYTQTSAHNPNCANAWLVSWAGLGGDMTGELIQAGTGIKPNGNLFAWWEILPDSLVEVTLAGLSAGDTISTMTRWLVDANGDQVARFTVQDLTQHTGWAVDRLYSFLVFDGFTAEFIDERPLNSAGVPFPLANFQNGTWWDAKIQDKDHGAVWRNLGTQTHKKWTMKEDGVLRADASSLSNGTEFTTDWFHC